MKELIPLATDRILCGKVGKVVRENLYEMSRKYWKLKLERSGCCIHSQGMEKHRGHCSFGENRVYWYRRHGFGVFGQKRQKYLWKIPRSDTIFKYVNKKQNIWQRKKILPQ